THTKDLFGMRTSHLPGSTYTHDVYSADFKLSGLGQRLGVNLGPLRWLVLSVTYGAKGYRVQPPIEHQRQLGFEVGLNLQQSLNPIEADVTATSQATNVGEILGRPITCHPSASRRVS